MKKNVLAILISILLVLTFLFYQRYVTLSWDWCAYRETGKFYLSGKGYAEVLRPPMAPLIAGIFSFSSFGDYMFILFSLAMFLVALIVFSRISGADFSLLLLLILNFHFLSYATVEGSELLSLSFLLLFLTMLIEGRLSAHFLALAFLTRYTNIIYIPLLLFHKNFRKILTEIVLFVIVIAPWLIYNQLFFGGLFDSIADSYLLNISRRAGYFFLPNIAHIIESINFMGITFLLGLRKFRKNKIDFVMLFFLILTLLSYIMIPFKQSRFLFNLAVPLAFFSYKFLKKLKYGFHISAVLFLLSFVSAASILLDSPVETPSMYLQAIEKLGELNASDCTIVSNAWVILNCYGQLAEPLTEENYRSSVAVVFKHIEAVKIKESPVFENELYAIYNFSCKKEVSVMMKYKDLFERFKNRSYCSLILNSSICGPLEAFEVT